MKDWLNF